MAAPSPAVAVSSGPTWQDVGYTYCCGLAVTGATAPFIHPFNVVAAAAAKTSQTSGKAAQEVYRGLGGNAHNAPGNFWNGLAGHYSKELVRSWGRIGGVVFLEKFFKENFSPNAAPHMLACVMAVYEVIFANPADVWKSYRSTGMQTRPEDLFKGSLGNFGRQYMMWFVWSKSTPTIGRIQESSGIDPKSKTGIATRSVAQSAVCTLFTYPTELLLRTVQVRAADYPVKNFKDSAAFARQCLTQPSLIATGAYGSVLRDLVRQRGVLGLGLGMSSKFIGNSILLGGANFLPMITAWTRSHIE